jgi:hypothetical protein
MKDQLFDTLKSNKININVAVNTFDYERHNRPLQKKQVEGLDGQIQIDESLWNVNTNVVPDNEITDCFNISTEFTCKQGGVKDATVSIDFIFGNWKRENYMLLPAAAYNGNRYESRPQPYMPFFYNFEDLGKEPRIILSDVPRLNADDGLSRIQERSGSMSTPSIGFFDKEEKIGFWLFFGQKTDFGDYGITFEENRNRDKAFLSLTNPVVRELYQYNMTNTHFNSLDVPAEFHQGDVIKTEMKILFFRCDDLQELFSAFNEIRQTVKLPSKPIHKLPYSEAFSVLENKFNTQNYNEKDGYYRVGMGENAFQDWQIGWTGGMISTYPLLLRGNGQSRERVVKNFEWLFENGISPAGLFWGIGENGNTFFGEFEKTKPLGKDIVLVRKQGDAIYYLIKQFMLMEKMGIILRDEWKQRLKGVIDTLVKIWRKNHQLGHYLNIHTNEIVVGGSTSGGIVPAALCLAGEYYQLAHYIVIAEEIGSYFFEDYVNKGITYGGVGDAMHNFDSESSYGLLESFALLYETTHKKQWLDYAEKMAHQFATWVINYDYEFPHDTLFGKLNMQTRGTVFANTQNKHLAPGICTHSGVALLRIFRATQNRFYINLLKDIVRAIPQYLSHPKRQIPGMKDGWMSERVNSTDWWEPIGEIFCGSTWSETSCMLSYAEIPGIYVIPETELVVCPDNIDARIIEINNEKVTLEIINKTDFDANVVILKEHENDLSNPLKENRLHGLIPVQIKKCETISHTI